MSVVVVIPPSALNGSVILPTSKSISNRALILNSITSHKLNLLNLSTADDTLLMQHLLNQSQEQLNLKNAGTCMRFLTAYYAASEGKEVSLLCAEQMEKRPIHELVNALRLMGASITYLKNEGFPPLHIRGQQLSGGTVEISAAASSQYVSALLMIAPLCSNDVSIKLTGAITSLPYIDMTIALMQQFGIPVKKQLPYIHIPVSTVQPPTSTLTIEPDWSAAAFWYQLVAFSKNGIVHLPGLSLNCIQGDHRIADYMKWFGVETIKNSDGLTLRKTTTPLHPEIPSELNLADTPDLAPSLAVVAAATNTPIILTGLQNLVIKESNRLAAMQTELNKLGFNVTSTPYSLIISQSDIFQKQDSVFLPLSSTSPVSTYNDHRIAMAFAPLSLLFGSIQISNPQVVEKSYPEFWTHLKSVSFGINFQ